MLQENARKERCGLPLSVTLMDRTKSMPPIVPVLAIAG
jgi:hypothetical protein